MICFNSDYLEGAHPRILQALSQTNLVQTPGYGLDEYCSRAQALVRKACAAPNADVHLLVGGTQTNLTFLSSALRPHQGAVSADSGHIATHESGAIEACGHKVIELPGVDGKLSAKALSAYCEGYYLDESAEHRVMPKVAYISYPTETGTLYTRAELTALRAVCDRWGLYLYLDGARLGYGLASACSDVTLPALAQLCDAFYIGGTKQGMLFGEALVIVNDALKPDFRSILKQKGGMLAKGRLLGIQFEEMFRDDLYFSLSARADALAMRLKDALVRKGYAFESDSPTNQQFPIMPDAHLDVLARSFSFSEWRRTDENHRAVRFCTSWATREEDVEALIAQIDAL